MRRASSGVWPGRTRHASATGRRTAAVSIFESMRARPLSPHMSVYRMSRYTLATSIFNRFTGAGLTLGLVLLVYWLTSVAGGPLAQARAARLLGSPAAKLIYAACIV